MSTVSRKGPGGSGVYEPSHPAAPVSFNMPSSPADPPASHPPTGPAAIHAPWRLGYLEDLTKKESAGAASPGAGGPPAAPTGSFLLDDWLAPERDHANHVIVRSKHAMILLNAFPYATGHLLVALGEARPTLLDYAPPQRAALWKHVDCACQLLQQTFEPQGVNIGINQGRAAGAGVPSHLHVHLVPRWGGDVNFITSIGAIRVIPASLEAAADRYRASWSRLRDHWLPMLDAE
jgi:ATP adenylyltransferase